MNDIIKIIKSLEESNVLIDGNTETVKYEIKEQEGGSLPALLAPLTACDFSSKRISGREVRRAGGGYMDKIF